MEEDKGRARESHSHRHDLAGEHPAGDAVQLVLFALFAGALILDIIVLKLSAFLRYTVGVWVRFPLSAVFFIGGYLLIRSSHKIVFGKERETPVLITEGPFSRIRHPMYTGILLMYLGGLAYSMSIAALPVFAAAVLLYVFIAGYEEKLLEKKFGDEYREYKKGTGLFFPRIGGKQ